MGNSNDLNFFIPAEIDLMKSTDSEDKRIIRGYASNSGRDRQDEEIVQKGLDISNFINFGWFNYDHDNSKIVGYPDKDRTGINSKGFYVEGYLLKGLPLAEYIWDLAISLKKSQAPRKLGFSVEGKVLDKTEDGRILKARVYNVAITPNPVNPTATWDAVIKSFTSPADIVGETSNPGMSAGYTFNLNEDSNGSVLKPESLEESLKNLSYLLGDDEEARKHMEALRTHLNSKNMTKSETILYLQIAKGLSRSQATEVYERFGL